MMLKKAFGIIALLVIVAILAVGGSECSKEKKTKTGSSYVERNVYAPAGLIATAISSSQITLTWVDNSPAEDGYYVERNSGGGFSVISTVVGTDIQFYDDKSLTPSTTFTYRVQAYSDAQGASTYSNEASATTYGTWVNIYAGYIHTIGVISITNRTLWAFGDNTYGQLGIPDLSSRNTPSQINTQTDWSTISAGLYHNLAIRTNGTIWGWGANIWGQLALGTTDSRSTPTSIGSTSDWIAIDCGGVITGLSEGDTSFSMGIRTGNVLSSTGFNMYNQLGRGITDTYLTSFGVVTGATSDWASFACGGNHTIARRTGNTLWSWGYNNFSQLGLGDSAGISATSPSQIGTDADWSAVFAGTNHSLAMKTDGTLWSWGSNDFSQLGIGSTVSSATLPTIIGIDTDWLNVSAGISHTIASKVNGTIWSWGLNSTGQLGLGDAVSRDTPTQIGILTDWSIIAAGGYHTLAINGTTRSLWVWGYNGQGQLGLGDTLDRSSPAIIVGK